MIRNYARLFLLLTIFPSLFAKHHDKAAINGSSMQHDDIRPERHWNIYAGGRHYYSRMKFDNPEKLDGFLTGIVGGAYYSRSWWFTGLNYEGGWSNSDLHGCPDQSSKINEHKPQFNLGVHHTFCDDTFNAKLYTGLGYHHYSNTQDPKVCDALKYKYHSIFIPVGAMATWMVNYQTDLGLHVQWRPDVFSRMIVTFNKDSDCDKNCNTTCEPQSNTCDSNKCDLEKEHGVHVEMFFRRYMRDNNRVSLRLAPFFDWKRFGRCCKTNENGVQFPLPEITRWNLGMKLSLSVHF